MTKINLVGKVYESFKVVQKQREKWKLKLISPVVMRPMKEFKMRTACKFFNA